MVKYSNKRLGRSFIKKRMTKRSSKMTRRRNVMKMYRGGGIQLLTFIAGLVVLSLSDAKYTVTPSNTKNSHEIDAKVARIHNNVFDAGEKLRRLMRDRGFTDEDKAVVFKRIKKSRRSSIQLMDYCTTHLSLMTYDGKVFIHI